jgi:hypothetical protein
MARLLVDTSYLISFADPNRRYHAAAVDWFRYCVEQGLVLELSTLVASEFEVGQPITDLPLRNFHVMPFNLPHARKAAELLKALRSGKIHRDETDRRDCVINDLKILGQAVSEGVDFMLTEDATTLAKYARRLKEGGFCSLRVVLLKGGFDAGLLESPDQQLLNFGGGNIPDES